MALPSNERTLSFSCVGQSTKNKYEGEFSFKCKLTMSEKYQLEVEKSRMLSDVKNPTPGLENIIAIASALKMRIKKAPQWWSESANGMNLLDDNVLLDVYDKSIEAEMEWEKAAAEAAGVASGNPTQVQK